MQSPQPLDYANPKAQRRPRSRRLSKSERYGLLVLVGVIPACICGIFGNLRGENITYYTVSSVMGAVIWGLWFSHKHSKLRRGK
jgi:hypothetical protein